MITKKTPEEIKIMREGGKRLAHILDELSRMAVPGAHTKDLNARALALAREGGDKPVLLGYHPVFATRPYPAAICVALNDEVIHGIPTEPDRTLQAGDIIGIDMSLEHKGLVVDMARTVPVGDIDAKAAELIRTARGALEAGIAVAGTGNTTGDIGHTIESIARGAGFDVVREFCGHGVGYSVHEEPEVPNFGEPGKGVKLEKGMVLALEPMVTEGNAVVVFDPDGYTVRTKDKRRSAHMEHTVAVGEREGEVLTRL